MESGKLEWIPGIEWRFLNINYSPEITGFYFSNNYDFINLTYNKIVVKSEVILSGDTTSEVIITLEKEE